MTKKFKFKIIANGKECSIGHMSYSYMIFVYFRKFSCLTSQNTLLLHNQLIKPQNKLLRASSMACYHYIQASSMEFQNLTLQWDAIWGASFTYSQTWCQVQHKVYLCIYFIKTVSLHLLMVPTNNIMICLFYKDHKLPACLEIRESEGEKGKMRENSPNQRSIIHWKKHHHNTIKIWHYLYY